MKICPRCGAQNYPQNEVCFHCGFVFIPPQPPNPSQSAPSQYPAMVPAQYYQQQNPFQALNYYAASRLAAKEKISEIVNLYISEGYRVISQSNDAVQLLKPKAFSGCFGAFLFFFFAVPFFIYLFVYLAMKDKQIYIEALQDGNIRISDERGRSKIYTGDSPWIVDRDTDYALWAALAAIVIVFIILISIIT